METGMPLLKVVPPFVILNRCLLSPMFGVR